MLKDTLVLAFTPTDKANAGNVTISLTLRDAKRMLCSRMYKVLP